MLPKYGLVMTQAVGDFRFQGSNALLQFDVVVALRHLGNFSNFVQDNEQGVALNNTTGVFPAGYSDNSVVRDFRKHF